MKCRLLGALAFAALTAALAVATPSSVARATGACDNSGAYTDTLCAGGHLLVNQYLVSPNGRYRFFYQEDGHTLIYDTIDWNNWDPSVAIFEPHEGASYLLFGVSSSGSASLEVNMWSFNSSNTSALPYYIFWGTAQNPQHYMRLENDGCLRAYDADGSFLQTMWC